jgi:hypothetical protein
VESNIVAEKPGSSGAKSNSSASEKTNFMGREEKQAAARTAKNSYRVLSEAHTACTACYTS